MQQNGTTTCRIRLSNEPSYFKNGLSVVEVGVEVGGVGAVAVGVAGVVAGVVGVGVAGVGVVAGAVAGGVAVGVAVVLNKKELLWTNLPKQLKTPRRN